MKKPLAEELRPQILEEIAGQDHLLGPDGFFAHLVQEKRGLSLLLWGPPGCGKTTLARLYAKALDSHFLAFSPLMHGIADLKKVIEESRKHPLFQRQIVMFVDEIHRFNKAQQDLFLPFLEDGTMILIGATTENPSFALNKALLSRLRVLQLKALTEDDLEKILNRYEAVKRPLHLSSEAKAQLLMLSQGDARHLLNMIENLPVNDSPITATQLESFLQKRPAIYDKSDDGHYNLISALHKAVRGSDPDAALYWLLRMLEGGESADYLARRMVRMAVEDVGLADPDALHVALRAWQAYDQLGSPEGDLALAEAIVYLALSPKSNAIYTAFSKAKELAAKTSHLPPPPEIINGATSLMKEFGYGKGYIYDHDTPNGFSGQNYFPQGMERPSFYEPVERGFEREMKKRLDYFKKLR
jgi:putative ATPase